MSMEMKKTYITPDCAAEGILSLGNALLSESLRGNGDINDTNPEMDWGDF